MRTIYPSEYHFEIYIYLVPKSHEKERVSYVYSDDRLQTTYPVLISSLIYSPYSFTQAFWVPSIDPPLHSWLNFCFRAIHIHMHHFYLKMIFKVNSFIFQMSWNMLSWTILTKIHRPQ